MEMSKRKKLVLIVAALLIIGASFSIGTAFGYFNSKQVGGILGIKNQDEPIAETIDFSPFWTVWSTVEEKYALPENINRQKMVWNAINGLLKSLDDPYTVFFPPEEKKMFDSEVRGNFEGVGMEIGIEKGVLTVISPIKGTPAYNAGIKTGDKILKIDGKSTEDLPVDEAVRLIRGERGTTVLLSIFSAGEKSPRDIKVVRDTIQVPIIDTEKKGDVYLIALHNFSERSPFEFQIALRQFASSGANKLVIDLRNNPGGYLEAAVDIASWFTETGDVILKERYRDGKENLHRSKGYNAFPKVPLVVLVNGGSASASEILAGALRDNGKAKLVGEKTFGKGSVQEVVPITSDTSLKITIARWLTPNGEDITKQGIKPDIEIKMTPEDIEKKNDPQLMKAIEVLSSSANQ